MDASDKEIYFGQSIDIPKRAGLQKSGLFDQTYDMMTVLFKFNSVFMVIRMQLYLNFLNQFLN